MFSRRDRYFEQQFRWEEDRWVFRFQQGGLPVVVSGDERDRLVAEHQRRFKLANRIALATFVGLAASASLQMAIGVPGWVVWIACLAVPLAVRVVLAQWAGPALTLHLRSRRVVGERLGLVGRYKMRAEVSRWGDLALQLVALSLYSFAIPYRVSPITKAIVAVGWLVVVSRIAIKWTARQRGLRGARWAHLTHRAHDLGDVGEDYGGR